MARSVFFRKTGLHNTIENIKRGVDSAKDTYERIFQLGKSIAML
jgi:hypothetical protein